MQHVARPSPGHPRRGANLGHSRESCSPNVGHSMITTSISWKPYETLWERAYTKNAYYGIRVFFECAFSYSVLCTLHDACLEFMFWLTFGDALSISIGACCVPRHTLKFH